MHKLYLTIFSLLFLSSQLTALEERNPQSPTDVQIYNEYPNNPAYYGNPYEYPYGYPPIPTPAEAFPDDAEANYLFNQLSK